MTKKKKKLNVELNGRLFAGNSCFLLILLIPQTQD